MAAREMLILPNTIALQLSRTCQLCRVFVALLGDSDATALAAHAEACTGDQAGAFAA